MRQAVGVNAEVNLYLPAHAELAEFGATFIPEVFSRVIPFFSRPYPCFSHFWNP
jgi:hypothetical protein